MKIYCPLCHKKVEVKNPKIETVTTSTGERARASGLCPKHKTGVSTYVSVKEKVKKPEPKTKRKVKSKGYTGMGWRFFY